MVFARYFYILTFICIASVLWHTPGHSADLYTVQHVKVDEKDEDANKAKIKALAIGQKKAFDTLLSRLVQEEYRVRLPEFDNRALSRYFAGLSVQEEKTGPTRYIATLTYRFKTKEVRDMLLSYGVPFQENRAESILVVPVWIAGGRNILFEDKNPWRDAWLKIDSSNSVTPILVPLGDTADKKTLTAADALKLDQQRFKALRERYAVQHIIVAAARPNQAGSSINLYLRGETSSGKINIENAVAGQKGELEKLTLKAANTLLRQIEQQYKRTAATEGTQADNLVSVSVPFNSFQEWNFIKARIENTESVQTVEVRQLSSQVALVDIIFSGDTTSLNRKLSREKLTLVDDGVTWSIRRLEEGQTGASPAQSSPQAGVPQQTPPQQAVPQTRPQAIPQTVPQQTGQPYTRPSAPRQNIEVRQLPPAQ